MEASRVQQAIAQEQIGQAQRVFEQQRGFLQPFQEPGVNALARIQAGIAPGGEFARPFTMDQFEADPGYAFRLSEGQKALERSAAARGGLISGSALKAASRFGQEMGSQEFQNAFARAQVERANVFNPLMTLYGGGLEAAGALTGAASGMGGAVGGYLGQSGAAQAAGLLGAGRAQAEGALGTGAAQAAGITGAGQATAGGILGSGSALAQALAQSGQFGAQGLLGAAGAGAQGVLGAGQAGAGGILGAAQARTSGYLGAQNTLASGLGGAYNIYQQQQLLNRLYPMGGSVGGGIGVPINMMIG
jgi:hypothetical protein